MLPNLFWIVCDINYYYRFSPSNGVDLASNEVGTLCCFPPESCLFLNTWGKSNFWTLGACIGLNMLSILRIQAYALSCLAMPLKVLAPLLMNFPRVYSLAWDDITGGGGGIATTGSWGATWSSFCQRSSDCCTPWFPWLANNCCIAAWVS